MYLFHGKILRILSACAAHKVFLLEYFALQIGVGAAHQNGVGNCR
jgi:hypothetical protein